MSGWRPLPNILHLAPTSMKLKFPQLTEFPEVVLLEISVKQIEMQQSFDPLRCHLSNNATPAGNYAHL